MSVLATLRKDVAVALPRKHHRPFLWDIAHQEEGATLFAVAFRGDSAIAFWTNGKLTSLSSVKGRIQSFAFAQASQDLVVVLEDGTISYILAPSYTEHTSRPSFTHLQDKGIHHVASINVANVGFRSLAAVLPPFANAMHLHRHAAVASIFVRDGGDSCSDITTSTATIDALGRQTEVVVFFAPNICGLVDLSVFERHQAQTLIALSKKASGLYLDVATTRKKALETSRRFELLGVCNFVEAGLFNGGISISNQDKNGPFNVCLFPRHFLRGEWRTTNNDKVAMTLVPVMTRHGKSLKSSMVQSCKRGMVLTLRADLLELHPSLVPIEGSEHNHNRVIGEEMQRSHKGSFAGSPSNLKVLLEGLEGLEQRLAKTCKTGRTLDDDLRIVSQFFNSPSAMRFADHIDCLGLEKICSLHMKSSVICRFRVRGFIAPLLTHRNMSVHCVLKAPASETMVSIPSGGISPVRLRQDLIDITFSAEENTPSYALLSDPPLHICFRAALKPDCSNHTDGNLLMSLGSIMIRPTDCVNFLRLASDPPLQTSPITGSKEIVEYELLARGQFARLLLEGSDEGSISSTRLEKDKQEVVITRVKKGDDTLVWSSRGSRALALSARLQALGYAANAFYEESSLRKANSSRMDDATTVSNDAIFKMVESFREMQPHGDYLLGDIDDRLEAIESCLTRVGDKDWLRGAGGKPADAIIYAMTQVINELTAIHDRLRGQKVLPLCDV